MKYFVLRGIASDHGELVFYPRAPQSSRKHDMRSREGATCTKEFLRGAFYSEENDIGSTVTRHTSSTIYCEHDYIGSHTIFINLIFDNGLVFITIVLKYLTQ